jgi:hypothetical protein
VAHERSPNWRRRPVQEQQTGGSSAQLPPWWLNEQASVYISGKDDPGKRRVFNHPGLRVTAEVGAGCAARPGARLAGAAGAGDATGAGAAPLLGGAGVWV